MAIDPLRKKMEEAADRADASATAFYEVLTFDEDSDVPVEHGQTVPSMSKRIKEKLDANMIIIDEKVEQAETAASAAQDSEAAAGQSATDAQLAREAAETASNNAASSASSAAGSASAAALSAADAQAASTAAGTARDEAQQYAANASTAGATAGAAAAQTRMDELADGDDPTKGASLVVYRHPFTGSVARTQADKDAEYFTVLDAGADKTGTLSSTAAFNKIRNYIIQQQGGTPVSNQKAVCVVIPPGVYKIDGFGWNLTNIRNSRGVHIVAHGVTLIGECTGYPVIDAADSRWLNIYGIHVYGSQAAMPRCGVQIGKGAVPTIGNNCIMNVTSSGYFSLAPFFNNASETTAWIRCKGENSYDSPTAYASVQDGAHYWQITSGYVTSAFSPGDQTSFTQNIHVACDYRNVASGDTIWSCGTSGHTFDDGCYYISFGGANHVVYGTSNLRTTGLKFLGHYESAKSSPNVPTNGLQTVVRFEGNGTNFALNGFTFHARSAHSKSELFRFSNLGTDNRISNADITVLGISEASAPDGVWFGGDSPMNIDGTLRNSAPDARFNLGYLTNFNGVIHTGDRSAITSFPNGAYTIYDRTQPGALLVGQPFNATASGGALSTPTAMLVPSSGTFTPTVTAATPGDMAVTYTSQSGMYYRIGKMVYVQVQLVFTITHTTASGGLRIGGLPFSAVSGGGMNNSVSLNTSSSNTSWPAGITQLSGRISPSQSYIEIVGFGPGVPSEALNVDAFSSGSQTVNIAGMYRVA